MCLGKHPWHVGLVREESKTGFLGWVRHLGGLIREGWFLYFLGTYSTYLLSLKQDLVVRGGKNSSLLPSPSIE